MSKKEEQTQKARLLRLVAKIEKEFAKTEQIIADSYKEDNEPLSEEMKIFRDAFVKEHLAMREELDKWRTLLGIEDKEKIN